MAYTRNASRIPNRAREIERRYGIDAGDDVVVVIVYSHRRQGHEHFRYYQLQYRERSRGMQRSSRVIREFSGVRSRERLEREMDATRAMLARSVEEFRVRAGLVTSPAV